jgi:hypothetical protein
MSWGGSVSIVCDSGLDDRGLVPGMGEDFCCNLCIQTVSGVHTASYPMGSRGVLTPGVKVQTGCDTDHSPPARIGVKSE